MNNPGWVIFLWTRFGKNLQAEADSIKSWKLDPQVEALLDVIWEKISPALQAALWVFIKQIYDKYGPDVAKSVLNRNVDILAKSII